MQQIELQKISTDTALSKTAHIAMASVFGVQIDKIQSAVRAIGCFVLYSASCYVRVLTLGTFFKDVAAVQWARTSAHATQAGVAGFVSLYIGFVLAGAIAGSTLKAMMIKKGSHNSSEGPPKRLYNFPTNEGTTSDVHPQNSQNKRATFDDLKYQDPQKIIEIFQNPAKRPSADQADETFKAVWEAMTWKSSEDHTSALARENRTALLKAYFETYPNVSGTAIGDVLRTIACGYDAFKRVPALVDVLTQCKTVETLNKAIEPSLQILFQSAIDHGLTGYIEALIHHQPELKKKLPEMLQNYGYNQLRLEQLKWIIKTYQADLAPRDICQVIKVLIRKELFSRENYRLSHIDAVIVLINEIAAVSLEKWKPEIQKLLLFAAESQNVALFIRVAQGLNNQDDFTQITSSENVPKKVKVWVTKRCAGTLQEQPIPNIDQQRLDGSFFKYLCAYDQVAAVLILNHAEMCPQDANETFKAMLGGIQHTLYQSGKSVGQDNIETIRVKLLQAFFNVYSDYDPNIVGQELRILVQKEEKIGEKERLSILNAILEHCKGIENHLSKAFVRAIESKYNLCASVILEKSEQLKGDLRTGLEACVLARNQEFFSAVIKDYFKGAKSHEVIAIFQAIGKKASQGDQLLLDMFFDLLWREDRSPEEIPAALNCVVSFNYIEGIESVEGAFPKTICREHFCDILSSPKTSEEIVDWINKKYPENS